MGLIEAAAVNCSLRLWRSVLWFAVFVIGAFVRNFLVSIEHYWTDGWRHIEILIISISTIYWFHIKALYLSYPCSKNAAFLLLLEQISPQLFFCLFHSAVPPGEYSSLLLIWLLKFQFGLLCFDPWAREQCEYMFRDWSCLRFHHCSLMLILHLQRLGVQGLVCSACIQYILHYFSFCA